MENVVLTSSAATKRRPPSTRHTPSVSPHVAVLSRQLHEGQSERGLCNQSSMLFPCFASQLWSGRRGSGGGVGGRWGWEPCPHPPLPVSRHPPPSPPELSIQKKMGVAAPVTRTQACWANKGRSVGASSSQTSSDPLNTTAVARGDSSTLHLNTLLIGPRAIHKRKSQTHVRVWVFFFGGGGPWQQRYDDRALPPQVSPTSMSQARNRLILHLLSFTGFTSTSCSRLRLSKSG